MQIFILDDLQWTVLPSKLQLYEKWKEEHDNLLKEKFRKQKKKENKLKVKKEEEEEERRRDCKYAFSNWWAEMKRSRGGAMYLNITFLFSLLPSTL